MNTLRLEQISQDGFIPEDVFRKADLFPGYGLVTNIYRNIKNQINDRPRFKLDDDVDLTEFFIDRLKLASRCMSRIIGLNAISLCNLAYSTAAYCIYEYLTR